MQYLSFHPPFLSDPDRALASSTTMFASLIVRNYSSRATLRMPALVNASTASATKAAAASKPTAPPPAQPAAADKGRRLSGRSPLRSPWA